MRLYGLTSLLPKLFRVFWQQLFIFPASLSSVGTPIGCILSGYLMDNIGRRLTLVITEVPLIIGWLLVATAQNVPMIYIGKLAQSYLNTWRHETIFFSTNLSKTGYKLLDKLNQAADIKIFLIIYNSEWDYERERILVRENFWETLLLYPNKDSMI